MFHWWNIIVPEELKRKKWRINFKCEVINYLISKLSVLIDDLKALPQPDMHDFRTSELHVSSQKRTIKMFFFAC